MPFTFAHPAAVLPFTSLKKWVSVTGLIIGSMVPDFLFFILFSIKNMYSHKLQGLLLFDLPCAIILAFIFHNIVRNPLINNLPLALKSRFSQYLSFNWNQYFRRHFMVVIISVLVGALSHLIWDGFTHDKSFFVVRIPILQRKMTLYGWHFAMYDVLQYLSTVIGMLVVWLFIKQLPCDEKVKPGKFSNYWLSVFSITALVMIVRVFAIYNNFYLAAVTGMSGLFIGLIITSLLFSKKPAATVSS